MIFFGGLQVIFPLKWNGNSHSEHEMSSLITNIWRNCSNFNIFPCFHPPTSHYVLALFTGQLLSIPKLYSSTSDEADGSMICAKMQAVVVKLKGPTVVNCWLLCKKVVFPNTHRFEIFQCLILFALDGDFYTKTGWRCLARLLSKRLERPLKNKT